MPNNADIALQLDNIAVSISTAHAQLAGSKSVTQESLGELMKSVMALQQLSANLKPAPAQDVAPEPAKVKTKAPSAT
jgi:hypothetical protein